jgi:gamma-glutamyltranspeptidase/glutathione hydrolase
MRLRTTARSARWLVCIVFCVATGVRADAPPGAAIASAHPLATQAGYEILAQGGNAFDAAVAVAAALAVVEPYSSGLGGGGFFLLHRARDGFETMVDGRETAPASARPERYLDASGNPVKGATTHGGTAVGIPGAPAALAHVAQRYGRLPLRATLAPAIRLAREGFPADARYVRIAKLRERYLQSRPRAAATFLQDQRAPDVGYLVRQPALAATLEKLATEGPRAFYEGAVARALVDAVNAAGGAWTPADLAGYRTVEREPLRFRYRGARIVTAPLPSAGGIALAQALGMLSRFDVGDPLEPRGAHLVIEALRRAFQDRARYLGDSDFTRVPVAALLDERYVAGRAASIDPARATPSASLGAPEPAQAEGRNTTHLSVVDADGNRVAATLSINWIFGSGIVAGDTGVLLNNEMDDFTVRSDVPNTYRLRGATANEIGPGKRPLSSMTPTFVEDARGVLVLGAPGGSRIVSQVLLAILGYMHAPDVDLAALAAAPRYHHQYWPDRVEIEPDSFSGEWQDALKGRGHVIEIARRKWGNMQLVFQSRDRRVARAASDPRGKDVAWY